MNLDVHHAIADRLESGKLAGWLSDYLVAWHGPSDSLSPNVTVWSVEGRNEDAVRVHVRGLLGGLVPDRDIVIAGS